MNPECIDFTLRVQQQGTCWFHSILSCLILIPQVREIIYVALAKYMHENIFVTTNRNRAQQSTNNYPAVTVSKKLTEFLSPSATCPLVGRWSKVYAMKYLWRMLYGRTTARYSRNSSNLARNVFGSNSYSHNFNIGRFPTDTIQFLLQRLNLPYVSVMKVNSAGNITQRNNTSQPIIITCFSDSSQKVLPLTQMEGGHTYDLVGASIGLIGNFGGSHGASHAICGFRCSNRFYIVDSNSIDGQTQRAIQCDWHQTQNILTSSYQNFTRVAYRGAGTNPQWVNSFFYFAVYAQRDFPLTDFITGNDVYGIGTDALFSRVSELLSNRESNNPRNRNSLSRVRDELLAEYGQPTSSHEMNNYLSSLGR
jgi:hypothetical protein